MLTIMGYSWSFLTSAEIYVRCPSFGLTIGTPIELAESNYG
jgi:hypothetical protein